MGFVECIRESDYILMEGALGERLKREYHLVPDEKIALASMIYSEEGRMALRQLWNEYSRIAKRYSLPFLATTPTRRANRERVERAGFTSSVILDNTAFLKEIRRENEGLSEMYIGGLMGCKGDAYTGEGALNEAEALEFHRWQAGLFAEAGVDFLMAGIMPALPEALGMARAMEETGVPYVISFTIQADGRLIDGTSITEAIECIDGSLRERPVCYMTNCVHPSIVYEALSRPFNQKDCVRERFWGIQANTSPLPYDQLDGTEELLCSEPAALAKAMVKLKEISKIKVFGGCCGTDGSHMEEIAKRLRQS